MTDFKGNPLSILLNPICNKFTAFTEEEREKYHLDGLVPPKVETLELQVQRTTSQLKNFTSPINQYIYLSSLQRSNYTLYYATLLNDLEYVLPIIYTPTVGEACQKFSHIWRGSHGMFIPGSSKGKINQMLQNWPSDEVDIIVVTDGSRILGLGDLGVNGMGIPIGKLALYVAAGGLNPARTLPITVDMGTNNPRYQNDPLYVGSQTPRVNDEEFFSIMEEFMEAVYKRWPKCLVQFEDFSTEHAFGLLEQHRYKRLCFNDDIQGTAAVILAGFISSSRVSGIPFKDQKIVFFGAGSAGVGIAEMIVRYLEMQGLSPEEARAKLWMVDSKGLITTNRGDTLQSHKVSLARRDMDIQLKTLEDVVSYVKPTCLFGLSTQPSTFTKEICELMAANNSRPTIFPLSNPTSKAECTAEEAYTWTGGRALFAAGSPFGKVVYDGKTFYPGQGNNLYIFPGLGLGSIVIGSNEVSDDMIMMAAETLADMVTQEEKDLGLLYPSLRRVREISKHIAIRVAKCAVETGKAKAPEGTTIEELVEKAIYVPEYRPLDI